MRKFCLVFVLLLFSCASVTREPGIERVRLVGTTPTGCKFVGEISGSYRGDSVSGGIVTHESQYSEIDFKNNVVKAGGNTVELRSASPELWVGEAYRCAD